MPALQALLAAGAPVNPPKAAASDHAAPLVDAASRGFSAGVTVLLAAGARVTDGVALHHAVCWHSRSCADDAVPMVSALLSAGARLGTGTEGRRAAAEVVRSDLPESLVMRLLETTDEGYNLASAVTAAIDCDKLHLLRWLLQERGADPNREAYIDSEIETWREMEEILDMSLLCYAAYRGKMSAVHELLLSGADESMASTMGFKTPLAFALAGKHTAIASLLRLHGATVWARPDDEW